MRTKNLFKFCILFLLVLFSFSFVSATNKENVSLIYSLGEIELHNNQSFNSTQQVDLPDTILTAEIASLDEKFKVISTTFQPTTVVNISSRSLDIDDFTYVNTSFNTSGAEYEVLAVHAFEVKQNGVNNTFTIYYNASELDSLTTPVVIHTPYDFDAGIPNMTRNVETHGTDLSFDSNTGMITITGITQFSAFFVAEDMCNNNKKDGSETGTDCGGICNDCSAGGNTGGGGGGGSSSSSPSSIVVIPTDQGVTAKLRKNDKLTILFNGLEYPFDVTEVGNLQATIKRTGTPYSYTVKLGEQKTVGLAELFSDDIVINIELADGFVIMSFKLYPEKKSYAMPNLLPPKKKVTPPQTNPKVESQITTEVTGQATTKTESGWANIKATPEPVVESPTPPKSPISLWTWIIASSIIVLLIGGIAVFRYQLPMGKPPTTTRAGLGESPKEISEPVLPFTQEEKPVVQPKPKPKLTLSKEKEMAVERYIYHALANGFTGEEVRNVLSKKGWSNELLDDVFTHITAVDTHMEKNKLHEEDTRLSAAIASIKALSKKGYSKEQIRQGLIRKGWTEDLAAQVLEKID